MKIMKKLAAMLLSVCLLVPCFATLTYAAEGQIVFSDPSTSVGETVEITGVVRADAEIGDADLNMTYDTEYLKFVSGDDVTENGGGQLSYSGKGTGSETELRFKMQFEVLKEGTTKVEVADYKAYLYSDEALQCQEGSSTVTIAEGDAGATPTDNNDGSDNTPVSSAGVKVTVDNVEYELSEAFTEADIPEGFAESTLEYNGGQYKVVAIESANIYLAYLVDAQGNGKFFMYQSEDATFVPFEQVSISDTISIMLLADLGGIKLPETYQKTDITLNNQVFPGWCNMEDTDYYILYAINSDGVKSLYQYDSLEGTYQRFEAPTVEKKDTSFVGKIVDSLQSYMSYVLIGAVVLFVIFIALVVILAVKLHNRNSELDELYDEYGIDLDEEEEAAVEIPKKEEKRAVFKRNEQPDEDDDFEDDNFENDDFENDDFEDDDFEDDDFEDDDFEDDDFEDDDFDDDNFKDGDFEDEFDYEPTKKLKKKSTSYDDFDVDFIDLDD